MGSDVKARQGQGLRNATWLAARAGKPSAARRPGNCAQVEAELFALLRGFREELAPSRCWTRRAAAVTSSTWRCGCCSTWRRRSSTWRRVWATAWRSRWCRPAQLHGIEVNVYARELAQTTIWIGYIQWLRENGFGLPAEPILKPLEAIRQMDAILDLTGFEGGA